MARTKREEEAWPQIWPGKIDESICGYGDDLTEEIEHDDTFHLGQSYENVAARKLMCSVCKGQEFNVGVGDRFTAIRCTNCEWEICLSDG